MYTHKSIFHWKLCSRFQPNEIDTNSMKSTWPTQTQNLHTQRESYSICSHWARTGLVYMLGSRWVLWGFALGPRSFFFFL